MSFEIIFIIVLLFSVIMHEIAHGYVAYLRGDSTAKDMGRLTLNPIPHIDLFGTIILPILMIFTLGFGVGWAKPVPVNPNNLKNPKVDSFFVSIAGVATNIMLAIIAGILMRIFGLNPILIGMFVVNIMLAVLNMIPIPPLDGSKALAFFLPDDIAYKFLSMNSFIGFILLIILLRTGVFSSVLIPIVNFLFVFLTGYQLSVI